MSCRCLCIVIDVLLTRPNTLAPLRLQFCSIQACLRLEWELSSIHQFIHSHSSNKRPLSSLSAQLGFTTGSIYTRSELRSGQLLCLPKVPREKSSSPESGKTEGGPGQAPSIIHRSRPSRTIFLILSLLPSSILRPAASVSSSSPLGPGFDDDGDFPLLAPPWHDPPSLPRAEPTPSPPPLSRIGGRVERFMAWSGWSGVARPHPGGGLRGRDGYRCFGLTPSTHLGTHLSAPPRAP